VRFSFAERENPSLFLSVVVGMKFVLQNAKWEDKGVKKIRRFALQINSLITDCLQLP